MAVTAQEDIARSSSERKERRRDMIPVDFPEVNCTYTADKCFPLPACQQMNEEFQTVEVISCHELTDEEIVLMLKQIKEGQRPAIYLSVIGGQPPVAMWVRE